MVLKINSLPAISEGEKSLVPFGMEGFCFNEAEFNLTGTKVNPFFYLILIRVRQGRNLPEDSRMLTGIAENI
jgi:hypothetical protein